MRPLCERKSSHIAFKKRTRIRVLPRPLSLDLNPRRVAEPQKSAEATGILPFHIGEWWLKWPTIKEGFVKPRPYQELLQKHSSKEEMLTLA